MKSDIIFLLLLFITIVSCKSSFTHIGDKNANYIPYYLKVYEADSLYHAKDYVNYKKTLKNLFNKYEPLNIYYYWEYEKYLKASIILDNKKKYNKELEFLITNFGYSHKGIKKDSVLSIALNVSNLKLSSLFKLEKIYKDGLDLELINKLNKIELDDQEIRNRSGITWEERAPLMKQVDRINDSIIKNYIITKGYPETKKTDGFLFGTLFNHFSYNGSYDFYKEKLPYYVKNGKCSPNDYASLIDRWNLINNGKLYYYISWRDEIKKIENDLEMIKKIDDRRREIGLPTIQQEKALQKIMDKKN